jgi:hypothetical protein
MEHKARPPAPFSSLRSPKNTTIHPLKYAKTGFSDLALCLLGPNGQILPMPFEANVVGAAFLPPLTTVIVEPGKPTAYDYSFFNYAPEYVALQREVATTISQPEFNLGSPDPDKKLALQVVVWVNFAWKSDYQALLTGGM